MAKMLKQLLAAMCCVAIIAAVPACHRDKDQDGHKKTKTTKYKKETKVKKEKQPKKEANAKPNRKMTTERVETSSSNY